MGRENIQFHLGSTFDGSGFDLANAKLRGANSLIRSSGLEASNASKGAIALMSALDMAGPVGAELTALKGIIGGIMSGGIVGAAIAVWAIFIAKLVEVRREADRLRASLSKKMAESLTDMRKEMDKDIMRGISKSLQAATEDAENLAKAFDAVANAAKEIAAAKIDVSQSAKARQNADEESFQDAALNKENDLILREVMKNRFNVYEAKRLGKINVDEAAQAEDAAVTNVGDAEQRVFLANQRRGAAREAERLARNAVEGVAYSSEDDARKKQYDDLLEKAKKARIAADNELTKAEGDLRVATLKGVAATNTRIKAQLESATSIRKAERDEKEAYKDLMRKMRMRDESANDPARGQRIAKFEQFVVARESVVSSQEGLINKAKSVGANQFSSDRKKARDAALDEERANKKEQKDVENIRSRMKNGTRVSERDRQRVQDFDEWSQLRNKGGAKESDQVKYQREHLENAKKNLEEVRAIRTELIKKLGVK